MEEIKNSVYHILLSTSTWIERKVNVGNKNNEYYEIIYNHHILACTTVDYIIILKVTYI